MICPKCGFEQSISSIECPKCGIIFDKYLKLNDYIVETRDGQILLNDSTKSTLRHVIKNLFFHVKPETTPLYFYGRVILFLILVIWVIKFILAPVESNYAGKSFLHLVNLPFHEAGHVLFRPFGRFIMVLGGSLGQLLMPLICFIVLLIKTRDTFGASITLWWLGESFMDLAPYINDARALKLMLLGGVTGRETVDYHDWEYILRKLGWLRYDHILATTAQISGILLMVLSISWAGYILFMQYKQLQELWGQQRVVD